MAYNLVGLVVPVAAPSSGRNYCTVVIIMVVISGRRRSRRCGEESAIRRLERCVPREMGVIGYLWALLFGVRGQKEITAHLGHTITSTCDTAALGVIRLGLITCYGVSYQPETVLSYGGSPGNLFLLK